MYNTEQRSFILEFFNNNPYKMFNAQEILDFLDDKTISRSTLYRNLAKLEELNKIKKHIKPGSKKTYYQYVCADECKGKIHLHCTKCENTFHMNEKDVTSIVDSVSQNENFIVDKSATVLYGICNGCQKEKKG